MPKESAKKIKLAPDLVLTGVLVGLFVFGLAVLNQPAKVENPSTSTKQSKACNGLSVGEECFLLETASTEASREKGLSNRSSLNFDSAMLFVFDQPGQQCMWMKDMLFNLDMVWLNDSKEIVKLEKNLSPATYPTVYCAPDTKYVLEFNSGGAELLKLSYGQKLAF
jgi:uncharacterized membrane protein (UPF0127 family)